MCNMYCNAICNVILWIKEIADREKGYTVIEGTKLMITINDWLELLTFLMILGCIIWWIVIWIGILVCRMTGKCPKNRVCRNSCCKYKAWCMRYR